MDKVDEELQAEDEVFEEVAVEEDDAIIDEENDDDLDAPGEEDVDPEDLDFGFSVTVQGREIDIDEDTEGDDTIEIEDISPLTATEVPDNSERYSRGDEVELPVDLLLASGQTEVPARDED
jgi:hypothetical protein